MAPPPTTPTAPSVASGLRRCLQGGRVYWLLQTGAWGGVVLLQMLWIMTLPDDVKILETAHVGLFALLGILVSHLMRAVIIGKNLLEHPIPSALPWLTGVLLMMSFLHIALGGVVMHSLPKSAHTLNHTDDLGFAINLWFSSLLLLTGWVGFYFAFHYNRRLQQSQLAHLQHESAARESELRALKAQINPHFLFNSLNSFRALIPRDQPKPREAVTRLADLLRASLNAGHSKTIPLSSELETVANYLALEQIRFEDRLNIVTDVPADTLTRLIPPFLLQTLIENAVKHGIARAPDGGTIGLTARVDHLGLRLTITNPGRISPSVGEAGFGLANARTRLQLIHGPGSHIELREVDGSVVTEILIPQPGHTPATNNQEQKIPSLP